MKLYPDYLNLGGNYNNEVGITDEESHGLGFWIQVDRRTLLDLIEVEDAAAGRNGKFDFNSAGHFILDLSLGPLVPPYCIYQPQCMVIHNHQ